MRKINSVGLLLALLIGTALPAVSSVPADVRPTQRGQHSTARPDSLPPAAASVLTLRGYGLYDFHYATGTVGGGAVLLDWQVSPMFLLTAGAEYASSRRVAGTLRCEATLAGRPQGRRLTLEGRYLWRHFPTLNLQEFTGMLSVGGHLHHVTLHLGLCNRYMADLVQRNAGGEATVLEPMNVAFAVEPTLFWNPEAAGHNWNLSFCWSNYNDFVVERVANWIFSLKGYWQATPHLRLTGEAGTHPVGSLNLTASYDGWFCHAGAEYRF